MPVKKEWVVDEKGFHAKSVWEPMPSDKTVVNIDETEQSSGKDKNNDNYEVELQKGTWLEGAEGFQFNKKCKVRVEGKFLKETNRTRVTINTYSSFRDEKNNEVVKEPLGQTIETNLEKVNKDGMEAFAEAQVMLYYGDKYSRAMRDNPGLTCRYTFTAQSNVAKNIMEKCEELEMPQTKHIDLKKGMYDDLAVKTYQPRKSGENGHIKGEAIKTLQENLQKIGIEGIGNIDGDFGKKTKEAVTEFQKAAGKNKRMKKDGKIIEETTVLTGYKDGIGDKPTVNELKKWVDKGWKIPKIKGLFPLPKQYQDKVYHSSPRSFGSSRNNGARAHAGCDLYAPLGKPIYAVADGKITAYYNYYWKTFALVVDHGDFIVLYGEVQPAVDPKKHGASVTKDVKDYIAKLDEEEKLGLPGALKIGSSIKRGDHIAYVGQLYTKNGSTPFKHTMLHFEKYRKTSQGSLTQKNYTGKYEYLDKDKQSLKFKRRKDLEDPTEYLDECELKD